MIYKILKSTLIFLLVCISLNTIAQTYPNKQVRVIVPFETGAPDSLARLIAQQLTLQTGQSFIVENRPGANGMIGADLVAKSKPDGHTLLVTSTSIVINQSYYKKVAYDLTKDLVPVTNLGSVEALFVVVNSKLPVKNLQEFLAYAKKKENNVSYGSPGNGNHLHIASALFNQKMGLDMVHIPFKGAGPASTALLGEQIQLLVATPPSVLPFIKDGKLRAIAYTGAKRASFLPDVPTVAEQGFPGFEMDGGWFAMFTTAGTPKEVVEKIQQEIKTAFNKKSVYESITNIGLEPVGDTPEHFKKYVDAEIKKNAELIRLLNIKADDLK
ncbi:MAG: tripartite tricarboxylate transporter substrate binding protein [Burkholderiales bacterium]|jgi:tripartite-type tricarboxylate transporter receptor subunit TctC|nr:tripartite tricarboxylate transporter substrate binding protein [Burkholderiales bacterium]